MAWPPGHYYSPIPCLDEVRTRESQIFVVPDSLPGINMYQDDQLALVAQFRGFYQEQPFGPHKLPGLRYFFQNRFFSYGDGLMLYCMLRHLRPRRLIEVGSGFSSALILDTNQRFLDGRMRCVFIEPYPDRLMDLLNGESPGNLELITTPLQDVDLDIFDQLQAGDVLFIDSTHVAKVGSDVNRLLFEVLPRLPEGIVMHLHDIFYPFEYPKEWVYDGRAWNEAYMLRAYLTFNPKTRIKLFNSFLEYFHRDFVVDVMPLWERNPGGSIWLERT